MSISHSSNRRRLIAGVSLVGLSVTFLAHTVARLTNEPGAPSQTTIALVGFEAVLNSLLMTGALLGLAQLLRARADWAGLLGAAFALVGWAVATRISALIQIDALLRAGVEGVPPAALESAFKSAPIVWTSVFPVGLFFPLGLITLGVALCWRSPLNRWCGLPLALGGLLFPVGRAAGHEFAVIACDLLLAAAFAAIGWGILTRREVWETTPG
jgi:hypothetical protein